MYLCFWSAQLSTALFRDGLHGSGIGRERRKRKILRLYESRHLSTLNPKLSTLNSQPSTLNFKP